MITMQIIELFCVSLHWKMPSQSLHAYSFFKMLRKDFDLSARGELPSGETQLEST